MADGNGCSTNAECKNVECGMENFRVESNHIPRSLFAHSPLPSPNPEPRTLNPFLHYHFVTGRLAEHALRAVVAELAPRAGFDYSIEVLNITVAALMTPEWVARRIHVPPSTDRVLLPGYCDGDLAVVEQTAGVPVERGPRDLRRLPEYFGEKPRKEEYGGYDIEILAEINHAPRLVLADILAEARRLK